MNRFLPAGRLSKVTEDGVLLQIQTEFSWHPNPRVATTVCLDGVVLHKIQKDWDAAVETEPQQRAVENFLNRQHDEIVSVIQSQKAELVRGHRSRDIVAILDQLFEIRGVTAAWCLNDVGLVAARASDDEPEPRNYDLSRSLTSMCGFLCNVSTLGDTIEGAAVLDDYSLIIVRRESDYYVVEFDSGVDYTGILKTVRSIMGNA